MLPSQGLLLTWTREEMTTQMCGSYPRDRCAIRDGDGAVVYTCVLLFAVSQSQRVELRSCASYVQQKSTQGYARMLCNSNRVKSFELEHRQPKRSSPHESHTRVTEGRGHASQRALAQEKAQKAVAKERFTVTRNDGVLAKVLQGLMWIESKVSSAVATLPV